MTALEAAAPIRLPVAPTRRPAAALVGAAVAGAVGLAVSLIGAGIPSLWGDEVVSIMSARRSWTSLADALGTIDAVHGLYYVLLHLWVSVVGSDAVAVRALSAVAVALAAAGMVPLVRALGGGMRPAVAAGLVLAVLPRVAYAGSDARSGALEIAGVVLLTLLLARGPLVRGGWRWLVYGIALGALVVLFLDTALLVPAHAVLVALSGPRGSRARALRRFALAVAVALALSAPVVVLGWRQRRQVAFLADREPTLRTVLVTPWFGNAALAVAAGILTGVAVLALVRGAPLARSVPMALVGAVVPSSAILALGAAIGGFYAARYVGFAAPWVALLLAVGLEEAVRSLARHRRLPAMAAGIAVLAGLAAPSVVAQRAPTARNAGTDWNEVAALVSARVRPGDGIAFDDTVRHSRRPRLALHAYPDAFGHVIDLGLVTPYDRTDGLWDVTRPLTPGIAGRVDRVWLVGRSAHGTDGDVAALRMAGFHRELDRRLDADTVSLWARG